MVGPWSRVDPATGAGLVLDLFIVSKELRPHISSLLLDSALLIQSSRQML